MLQIICSIKFWFSFVETNPVGDDILDYVLSGAARGLWGGQRGVRGKGEGETDPWCDTYLDRRAHGNKTITSPDLPQKLSMTPFPEYLSTDPNITPMRIHGLSTANPGGLIRGGFYKPDGTEKVALHPLRHEYDCVVYKTLTR